MRTILRLQDLVNSGDLYTIEEKISDLKFTLAACFGSSSETERFEIEKMQYQLSMLEDVKHRIMCKHTY